MPIAVYDPTSKKNSAPKSKKTYAHAAVVWLNFAPGPQPARILSVSRSGRIVRLEDLDGKGPTKTLAAVGCLSPSVADGDVGVEFYGISRHARVFSTVDGRALFALELVDLDEAEEHFRMGHPSAHERLDFLNHREKALRRATRGHVFPFFTDAYHPTARSLPLDDEDVLDWVAFGDDVPDFS